MKPPTKDEARGQAGSDEAAKQDRQHADTTAATPTPQAPADPAPTCPIAMVGEVRLEMIHAEHKAAQSHQRQSLQHAFRCGDLLLGAKRSMPHGEWSTWLSANVRFSDTSARGYMRLANMDEAKRQRVADLSLRDAIKQISKEYDKRQHRIEKQVDRELAGSAPASTEIASTAVVVPMQPNPNTAAVNAYAVKQAKREARAAAKAPKPESKCASVKDHVDDCRAYIAKHFLSIESREDRGEFLKRVNAILRQYAGEINKEAREARKPDREADDAPEPAKTRKTNKVLKDVEARLNAMFNNRGAEQ